MDLESGELLLNKGGSGRVYPASLTKIMTAIIALENIPDLEQKIALPETIFGALYTADASMAGFLPGEEVPALDLLYGIMLPSGAECCIGLAEYIAGSEEAFVTLMNQKASELGMKNTNFMNTTGLHDEDHYSTAKDLALLLRYSLQNDTFRGIFTTESYTSTATNKHPEGITMHSTMFKNLTDNDFPGGKLLGGKTGYTGNAGLCLASLAKIGDREYIMVSAGADGDHTTEQFNITDALTVYHRISDNQSLSMVSDE
jgi:D-alanyl-D-alanine carboxypeptidase (penicillin-binding protein 5/6)